MKFRVRYAAVALGAMISILPVSGALAQRPQPTPEQRIERLERQIQQMQRQIFPRGRPADTAGFSDEPAATQSSVASLDQRLDALERQMADILRMSEENGNQLRTLTSDLQRARDEQQQRINALEQRIADAAATVPVISEPQPAAPKPTTPKPGTPKPATTGTTAATGGPDAAVALDAGEEAYTEGFKLWEAGQYDQAINSLRAFTSAYPKHRRASYANNLIGRALLDKGQPRAAAEALLANYRNNPKGERAPDSLYYLGQSLMRLGQPAQACKAYQELDAVYGAKVRADLRKQLDQAKASANCS
ncbi:tetratricopeptide repeat protein [Sphingomonas hankyongi]|uniref:Tetratricopeptide repeat protein n=1 Tax=Sphingomonas hankyongi TaxID=2908209 RepID=A0ABT0S2S7_9SPHN|nr:tetratricopeptide repeat protein [Sphingomonas hankyongi]